MLDGFDKRALLSSLVAELGRRTGDMRRRAKAVAASATHEEARPEGDKDTRAIEESYLARGQAARAAEAETDLQMLSSLDCQSFEDDRPIAATAVAGIEDEDGNVKVVLLLPVAGGVVLESQGIDVHVVTPTSPLGRGLLGKTVDDDFEVSVRGTSRCWTVMAVR